MRMMVIYQLKVCTCQSAESVACLYSRVIQPKSKRGVAVAFPAIFGISDKEAEVHFFPVFQSFLL